MAREECIALLDRYANYDGMGIPKLAGCKEAMKKAVELLSEEKPSKDLEEAAEEYARLDEDGVWKDGGKYKGFIAGAQWRDAQIPKLPDNVDEAAEKAGIKRFPMEPGEALDIEGNVYETNDKEWPTRFGFIQGFKAGAEWMAKQMPMPEDTVIFQKGVAEGKRLMMEDAVEGKVAERVQGKLYTRCQVPKTMGFEFGDKVKIIIVKEEDER